jgi:hypothetical protein
MPQLTDSHVDRPDTPDPDSVVQGTRKRRPTQRLRENGDPLAHKRAKQKPSSAALTASNPPTASPALQVIEGGSATARNVPAASTSLSSLQGLVTADLTDDGLSDGLDIQPIDVDDGGLEDFRKDEEEEEGEATECEETDDAELGKLPITIFNLIDLSDF